MASISLPLTGSTGGRGAMAGIEARRLARHPAFLVGVAPAFGVVLTLFLTSEDHLYDILSMPVVPAFFIGLPTLMATAGLTRSTESASEAVGTAPGTEARRTTALAIACLVPAAAGALVVAAVLVMAELKPVVAAEWWFGTLPDWQVWSILIALGPVACLGAGLLGTLTARWVRFPGSTAVVVVALVAVTMVGQIPFADGDSSALRLWVPWAMFHSGSMPDGTALVYSGNPLAYLGYVLCLCAAAFLVARWHDRTARTRALRVTIAGVVVVGIACLALAATTGNESNLESPVRPAMVSE